MPLSNTLLFSPNPSFFLVKTRPFSIKLYLCVSFSSLFPPLNKQRRGESLIALRIMDNTLFDELLQEIFQKLPSSSAPSVSLVSKRWFYLYRSITTSLSLRHTPLNFFHNLPLFISLLSYHPSLSSLSLLPLTSHQQPTPTTLSPLLLSSISSRCSNLLSLKFLLCPVSISSLTSLSKSCTNLRSLCISLSRPIYLNWVSFFPCLKELSIVLCSHHEGFVIGDEAEFKVLESDGEFELGLESVCIEGIRGDDWGVCWLWRRCKKLKKLKLLSCEGVGGPYSSFVQCLQSVQEIELKTCRSVVDMVLLKLIEHCLSLESLLVHDGGSREGLLHFFSQSNHNLLKLDFRLPMDLENNHFFPMALNFRNLSSLRLQSCCLVTCEGLKAIGIGLSNVLEELALINCDVVEREPGLLATLGQHLRQLKKLDLSHNEMLLDKEFVSMLVSCIHLVDLKVRGCKGLTGVAMVSMARSCKKLENVDVVHCLGIDSVAIEMFVKNCSRLRRLKVEGSKLSDAAKMWASKKFIDVVV